MNILFVHQNFPGQYQHLAQALVTLGHRVVAIRQRGNGFDIPGVLAYSYHLTRGNASDIHPYALEFETKVLRAEACAITAMGLRDAGFIPDVIHAHPGWGEALYLRDIFPHARLICYAEYFYQAHGQDVNFDPEFPCSGFSDQARLHTKNSHLYSVLDTMDCGISPTHWQANTFPAWAKEKLHVIHDGIDTDTVSPDASARVELPQYQLCLKPGDEVLTFVARNLEPVRGYHSFMRALPEILRTRPKLRVFIIGGDDVSYGIQPAVGSYKQRYLDEVMDRLDVRRVFFMGKVNYWVYLRLLQVSRCHVYLSYPFVLSWSMLEAMSAGTLVVASRTAPIQEVIQHGENGLLVDFFATDDIAAAVCAVLSAPDDFSKQRLQARETIIRDYDLNSVCLPRRLHLTLLSD